MSKISEWSWRYLPAEIAGIALTVLGSRVGYSLSGNLIIAAYAGTIADYVGYYGVFLTREMRDVGFRSALRNILIELGPAELLDYLVVRPGFLALFPLFVPSYGLAIFLGSIAASLIFYAVAVSLYEVRKRHLR